MKTLSWTDVLDLLAHGDPKGDDPLGRIVTEARVSTIVRAFQHADSENTKRQLFRVLAQRKPKRYAPVFIPHLDDPSPLIRFAIAEALGAVGYHPAIPSLVALLRDPDEMLRAAAAWALGRLEEKDTLPALKAALATEAEMYARLNMTIAVSTLTGGPKTLDEFYAQERG